MFRKNKEVNEVNRVNSRGVSEYEEKEQREKETKVERQSFWLAFFFPLQVDYINKQKD